MKPAEIRCYVEPRDLWVGLYWDLDAVPRARPPRTRLRAYLCIVPCVPIRFTWEEPSCLVSIVTLLRTVLPRCGAR